MITRGGTDGQPARVLVQHDGTRWRLPVLGVPAATDGRALAPGLRAAIAQRFGLDVAVLSLLAADREAESGTRSALVALDAFGGPADPNRIAGWQWVPLGQIGGLTDLDDASASLVRDWLHDLTPSGGHALRLPWTRPGWLREAVTWVEAQVAQAGLPLAGPIEQQRTWCLSALLSAPLVDGSAYFKALPPMFAAEPRLTQRLAEQFPGLVPDVISLDEQRYWLLMRGFSGTLLHDCGDLEVWIAATQAYARLQAATAAARDFLRAPGIPDRRLPALPAHFAAVLGDDEVLELTALKPEEHAGLTAIVPLLPAACAALEACGVPYVLEHGDLHGNNIAVTASGFVIFDWSDGCLAHPFTCLTTLLERVPSDWHDALSQAYAREWSAFASPESLKGALRLARPLGAAHHAISYANILRATEPGQRWQLAGALPFFLREVLKYKDDLAIG